jgi:predicted ester cyclase
MAAMASSDAATANETDTGAVAKAYFDAIGERDVEAMVACWEPGTVDRVVGMADLRVPEGLRQWFGATFEAVPDFGLEVLDMLVDGDKAAVRWRARGTFDGTGKIEGVAPTGSSIDLEGFDMITVRDGKIVSNDAYTNGMEMARQMGVMPSAGSAAERAMLAATNARTAARDRIRGLLNR